MKIIKNIILTIGIILIAICFIVNIRYIVNIIDSWQETATITNYTILHIAISILIAIAIEIICFILNKLINRDKKINRKKIFIIAILIIHRIMDIIIQQMILRQTMVTIITVTTITMVMVKRRKRREL